MTTGTLEHLDPQALDIEPNVRTQVTTDKGFLDSIRANGVLVPILGWRDEAGVVHVRAGRRRALAARETGQPTIPVYLVDAVTDDEARRLVEQMVENEQRDTLTDLERVEAWKQMELAGLSVTAIARKTGAKRDHIKTGLTVAGSVAAGRSSSGCVDCPDVVAAEMAREATKPPLDTVGRGLVWVSQRLRLIICVLPSG